MGFLFRLVSPRRAFPVAPSLHTKVCFANNLRIPAQNKKGKKAEAEIGSGGIQYRLPPLLFRVRLRRTRKSFPIRFIPPIFALEYGKLDSSFLFLERRKGKGVVGTYRPGVFKRQRKRRRREDAFFFYCAISAQRKQGRGFTNSICEVQSYLVIYSSLKN